MTEYTRIELPLVMPEDKEIVKWNEKVWGVDPLSWEGSDSEWSQARWVRYYRRRA